MSYNSIRTHSPTSRSKNLNTSRYSPSLPSLPTTPKHSQLSHSHNTNFHFHHPHPFNHPPTILTIRNPITSLLKNHHSPHIRPIHTPHLSHPRKNVPQNLPPPLLRPPRPRTYQAVF